MGTNWHGWAHGVCTARGIWLPGDPRGFRDHNHRIHSYGDYRLPGRDPVHAKLHEFADRVTSRRILLPPETRAPIAEALCDRLQAIAGPVRIACVTQTHAHVLFHAGNEDAKSFLARAKQAASHAVREELPGTIWSKGCHVVRIRDDEHYRCAVQYIDDHRNEGGSIWINPKFRVLDP